MDNNTENFTNTGMQGGAENTGSNPDNGNAVNTDPAVNTTNTENTEAPINISGAFANSGVFNEYTVNTDPGYTQGFVPPANDGGDVSKPKKKKPVLGIVIAVVAILAVAAGVLGFVFRAALANTWARMTKSPEEYTQYVLQKNLIENDALWKGYEEVCKQADDLKGLKVSGELRMELSKDMIHGIEDLYTEYQNSRYSYMGEYYDEYMEYMQDEWDKGNYDYLDYNEWEKTYAPADNGDKEPAIRLDALSNIALLYEFERTEEEARAMQALQLSDRDNLLTLNELYDSNKHTFYIQMPEINKDYAKVELDDFLDEDELEKMEEVLFGSAEIAKQTIDPKVLKSIYNRYMNILISKIDNVDEKNDTLEIAGEEQKCISLTFTADEEMVKETARDLLETLADDEELRQAVMDSMKEMLPNEDFDDSWDEFTEEVEQALEDLDDAQIDQEWEITLYVNKIGQIIGLRMEEDSTTDKVLLCGYVLNKGQLYAGLYCTEDDDELLSLEGNGKLTSSGATMDFTLTSSNLDDEITFAVEDLNGKGGVFKMDLRQFYDLAKDEIENEIDDEAGRFVNLMKDATLQIEYHAEVKATDLSVALMEDDEKIICISSKMSVANAGTIEMPSSKETENIRDEMDLLQYASESDLGALVDALEELGLPEDAANDLRDELDMISYY